MPSDHNKVVSLNLKAQAYEGQCVTSFMDVFVLIDVYILGVTVVGAVD